MGEPRCQQELPAATKEPFRITLTLFGKWGELSSLDPLCRALLSPRMFEIMRSQRGHLNGFLILSDQADLSISFPYQLSAPRTFAASWMIGAVGSFVIFYFAAISSF